MPTCTILKYLHSAFRNESTTVVSGQFMFILGGYSDNAWWLPHKTIQVVDMEKPEAGSEEQTEGLKQGLAKLLKQNI